MKRRSIAFNKPFVSPASLTRPSVSPKFVRNQAWSRFEASLCERKDWRVPWSVLQCLAAGVAGCFQRIPPVDYIVAHPDEEGKRRQECCCKETHAQAEGSAQVPHDLHPWYRRGVEVHHRPLSPNIGMMLEVSCMKPWML